MYFALFSILAIVFVTGCSGLPKCPGHGGYFPPGGLCKHECYSDSGCSPGKICCSNGCGSQCITPPVKYDSQCPKVPKLPFHGGCAITCRSNSDCPGYAEMCCYNGCGSQCVKRVSTPNEPIYDSKCPKQGRQYLYPGCVKQCYWNKDCRRGKVCCPQGCNSKCVYPPGPLPPPPVPTAPVYDSRCPAQPRHRYPGSHCVHKCFYNPDCRGKICCPDGCGSSCIDIPTETDPRCPPANYIPGGTCDKECRSNRECDFGLMCCSNGCGHKCISAAYY